MRLIAVCCGLLLAAGCTSAEETAPFDPKAPKAHHTKDGFRNLYVDSAGKKGLFDFLFKVRFKENWPDEDELRKASPTPRVPVKIENLKSPPTSVIQATWIGHSTFLIQYRGKNILTDPIFSDRASPVTFAGPLRYSDPALSINDLPPIDAVVISHNHYDHMDEATIQAIGNRSKWLVPLGNAELLKQSGITNVVELDWWEDVKFGDILFTLTPTQHWSGRGLFDRFKALWGSWAIDFTKDNSKLWFGGDTGYNPIQFKEIGERLGPFHLSFIPIGAYDPRWFMKESHTNPEEAVKIHQDIRSAKSIGMHWGTFVLTSEPVEEPPIALRKAAKKAGLKEGEFITLPIGGIEQVKPAEKIETGKLN